MCFWTIKRRGNRAAIASHPPPHVAIVIPTTTTSFLSISGAPFDQHHRENYFYGLPPETIAPSLSPWVLRLCESVPVVAADSISFILRLHHLFLRIRISEYRPSESDYESLPSDCELYKTKLAYIKIGYGLIRLEDISRRVEIILCVVFVVQRRIHEA
ncbi:unnamed protein product [Lactuca saligna]|uniref:Uncharacterized protein n=1 Tax=Lactuca saligna TaxID=75948 RepID=A0AA35YNH4_LACSI|nr:unnamed protein product [Lactuca saligna]